MSILINGIEMPKEDGDLLSINIYPNGKVTIAMDLECKQIATAMPVPQNNQLTDSEMTRKLVSDCNNLVRVCKEIERRVVSWAKPSAQSERNWTPCSKRSPEIDMSYPHRENYIVQYDSGRMDVASWSNIDRFCTGQVKEPYWNCAQIAKVVAWMPLPEPYKEG